MKFRMPPDARPDRPDLPPPAEIAELLRAFENLVALRREVAAGLPDGPVALEHDPDDLAAGHPLLSRLDPAGIARGVALAAGPMLPGLAALFPPIASACANLGAALAREPALAADILAALLDDTGDRVAPLAARIGLPAQALPFLARELVSAVLRRLAATLSPLVDDAIWQRGNCPVCGAAPDCGLLKEHNEPTEFLIAKAGRLGLHCSLCGHVWRFPRLVCPVCGETEHEKRDLFMAVGRERERIHACSTCGRYLLVADRVECDTPVDPDMVPIRLVHLDLVAQARGYTPIAQTAWNQFPG